MSFRGVGILLVACGLALKPVISAQATPVSVTPPAYPLAAQTVGIDGKVMLHGTIGTDGKIKDLRVLSGPPQLQQAAIDAVMHWTYKPYKHFGQLVEVDTTVTANFNLGNAEHKADAQAKAKTKLAEQAQQVSTQDGSGQQPSAPKQESAPEASR
jgi:TonB family protein